MNDPMRLTIFGAGMAGLIAARMLSDRHPLVAERQASLPNNHSAVLRFRSSLVGDATNIGFKSVNVIKSVLAERIRNPISNAAIYSRKVTGCLHARSVLDLSPSTRYIAPPDFISRLASTADIQYGVDFQTWSSALVRDHGPVISTIPVPAMMKLFGWPNKPEFNHRSGWVLKAQVIEELDCQLHATIYSARFKDVWYRATLTGSDLMIEGTGDKPSHKVASHALQEVMDHFGMFSSDIETWKLSEAKYQKISELATNDRESVKRFIMHLSSEFGIYSLGRFATWRPKLLLDDLVNDVRVIARLIDGESLYNENLGKKG